MASFHDVANEKSSVFEDADCDPDLEARLYAEIYYSNDNYQQDYDTTDNDSRNLATSLASSAEIGNDNFAVGSESCASRTPDESSNRRSDYPSNRWVSGKNTGARGGSTRAKQPRALAHKDLWLQRAQPDAQRRSGGTTLQNLDELSLQRRSSEAETLGAAARRSEGTRNNFTQLGNRSVDDSDVVVVGNRADEAGRSSALFGGGTIDCGNISTGANCSDVDNFSIQLRSGTTVNRSDEAGRFSTRFGGSAIDCGNISTGSNRFNAADNFSIQLRSGATVNRCNETENTDRQFGGGAISANNFALRSNHYEARNDCSPLQSGSIAVDNSRLTGRRCNEARNFSSPFGSGTIDDYHFAPGVDHSDISSPQFGRKNSGRNNRTIVTRSKTALRRRNRNADAAQSFVAESLEADFVEEDLFNLSLAQQVTNFGSSLCEGSLANDIRTRRKLEKSIKKREKVQRQAERRRKRKELRSRSKYPSNANVIMDGKYKVVSKKNKLKMKEIEPEPVDISSDSDDSILEVPVPPKTPPPVIQLQDSDDDLDTDIQKSRKSSPNKGGNTNSDESSTSCSDDDSGKSGKSRSRKEKKSAEGNRDESAASLTLETDFSAESSAEPIAASALPISRETPKKTRAAENSVGSSNTQECEEVSGKSSKNRQKKGKKSAEENREESAISRVAETGLSPEPATEPISRETPKKTKNVENSVGTPNNPECEDDSGKSSKNRSRKGKKSAEESREESALSRVSETDLSAESSTEPIAKSSSTISQKTSRDTPKKAKNTEHSTVTSNIQECEDEPGKSLKNRPKKGKKSAEEPREESAASLVSETDFPAESSAEPIADFSATGSQKNSRDTPKKTKHAENSGAASNDQECEDDSAKSNRSRTKRGKKSAEESREKIVAPQTLESSSKDDEPSAATIREAKLQKILKDVAKKTKDTEVSAAITDPDAGNLILNCTEIQKGASTLEDIRKMREAANLSHAHSDDSMTEGEANNWVNIATGQANSSRKDVEVCSISSSVDGSINPALWDQLAQENRAAAADSSLEIEAPSAEDFLPIQTTGKNTDTDFHAPVTNSEAANSRKRQQASSSFNDFDVPAVPEKRAKSRQKSSREQTMTEYFFKPMSKELQAFYNNPWGGENLDVYDVQSRMPRNPNCWAILDADLQGPASKKRRLCPRCKTDTHFGRRCPEKAKPPCCYMCGAKGHTESRCPHTMCLTCGRKYATYRPTCGHCSQLHCTICDGSGHNCENCPDLWRRYHNTTTSTPPIIPKFASSIMKPTQNLSCCNCAKRGHDVTMCRQLRWSQHFPTPMYITSYTAGPMYEPANSLPIQQPLISDSTEESPHEDRYFDADPNNSSIPEFPADEFLQNPNPDSSIETIEIPDDSASSEPQISLPEGQIIFRAGEFDPLKTLGWPTTQKRLDILKTVELTGILSGIVRPDFLLHWQAHLQFAVEIIHDIAAGTFVRIACGSSKYFREFENVIWQWLTRTDAEKAYLFYETNPFEVSSEIFDLMRVKLMLTRNVMPVVKLLKKIASSDRTLITTAANVKARKTKKNRRRITSLFSQSGISSIRRCQLITSLYSGNFVEKSDIILHKFRCLARERLRKFGSDQCLAPREYLQLVHVYNEIFTFHQTEALTRALEKAIASFRAENPEESKSIGLDSLSEFPKAEIFRPLDQSNILAATIAENRQNSAADPPAECVPLLANSAANIEAQVPLVPRKINEGFSNDSQVFPAPIYEIPANDPTPNSQRNSSGIFMHCLGKKARRTYRRLAKSAIKAANKSNVPRLQKIAKALKTKIANCTALTEEIDSLQREITNDLRSRRGIDRKNVTLHRFRGTRNAKRNLRQREQNQQSQQDSACDNDPTCVTFLRDL